MIKAAKEFENRIKDERRSRIKRYPCYTNRASEIGHPCERYLYFNRTEWDKTELHDEGLQAIFDEGHHQEKEVIKTLMAADIEVFHQQTAVSRDALFKKYNISGHMDLKVRVADRAIPCDVKSMAPHYFESVNTQADFENHSAPHIRKYIAQLMIYSIGSDEEYGYMILKNKSTGQIKFVLVKIDFGYVESLIQKAERINGYVATKTPPPLMAYDHDYCDRCKHQTTCNPEIPSNYSLYFMQKPEFLEDLQRLHSIEEIGKEYAKLDKKVKGILKESEKFKITIGEFLLTCNTSKNGAQRWKRQFLDLASQIGHNDFKP